MTSKTFTPRAAHELEEAGEPRWAGRMHNDLLMVRDLASGEEYQATAYTLDGDTIRFALPFENGLRSLTSAAPGYDAFKAVIEKSPLMAPSEPEKPKTPAKAA